MCVCVCVCVCHRRVCSPWWTGYNAYTWGLQTPPHKHIHHHTAGLHPGTPHRGPLRAQVTVLSALHFTNDETAKNVRVVLDGWPVNRAVIRCLAGLPQWLGVLDLSRCTWPLPHAEYRSLAYRVPVGFASWELSAGVDLMVQIVSCWVNLPEPVYDYAHYYATCMQGYPYWQQ